jgi:Tat protein secretion system quality control protein TatD with DNase activity
MNSLLYNALVAKYESDKAQALATLEIYFKSSVGIGEHPQQVEEMDKMVELLATAEDKLSALKNNFTGQGEYKY